MRNDAIELLLVVNLIMEIQGITYLMVLVKPHILRG